MATENEPTAEPLDRHEPRYTLTEAKVMLAREECLEVGHNWSVIAPLGGPPTSVVCDRCGCRYLVERGGRP